MKVIQIVLFFYSTFSVLGQIVDIPDDSFKSYLIDSGFDSNNDGEIQISEAEVVTFISIPTLPIRSLEGIQSFTSLEHLSYSANCGATDILTEINLSNNINLKWLDLNGHDIETIDLANNINLEHLDLSFTSLSSIDLANNINLLRLYLVDMTRCGGPGISTLDLSANINLREINVAGRNLSFLNIQNGNNQSLEDLNTNGNSQLTCIQVDNENYVYPDCVFAGDHLDGWCVDRCLLTENCELNINKLDCEKINIYPNPASDILTIESKKPIESLQVFDMSGSIVFWVYWDVNSINISRLQRGVYFLKLKTSDNIYNQKLIIN